MEEEVEVSRRLLSAPTTMSLGAVYTGLKEEELTMRGRRPLRRRLNTRIANGIEVWRGGGGGGCTRCARRRDVFVVWARWSTHV